MFDDLISRAALLEEIEKAQATLESNEDKIWDVNKKYFQGLAWAHRLVSDAPQVKYTDMLRPYQEDLPDNALLDEAIATLENFFSYMDKGALLHHSRPLAIAYLALKHEQNKKSAEHFDPAKTERERWEIVNKTSYLGTNPGKEFKQRNTRNKKDAE